MLNKCSSRTVSDWNKHIAINEASNTILKNSGPDMITPNFFVILQNKKMIILSGFRSNGRDH